MFDIIVRIILIIFGYLSGSVLYAEIAVRLVKGISLTEVSVNHNPGVSNAFHYGGRLGGSLAVAGDLLKGIIPVGIYTYFFGKEDLLLILMLLAPVIGHAFPCYKVKGGGMCITTSFGVLIGLLPMWQPLITLVVLFLLSLLVPKINTSVKSIAVFVALDIASLIYMITHIISVQVFIGVLGISLMVVFRMKVDLRRRGLVSK